MFLKFQITCTCNSKYTIDENISAETVSCPNCGLEYPHSAKVLSILKTAKEITDSNPFKECSIKIISENEDMKSNL